MTTSSRSASRCWWPPRPAACRPQLLARPEDGRQLPGAGAGADPADGLGRAGRDGAAGAGHAGVNLMVRDVATVGRGIMPGEYRPHVDAALPEHHRQRRGRGPGPGRRGRSTQAIDAAGEPPRGVRVERRGPGRADGRDVPVAGHRPGRRGRGDPGAADRLLPVAAAGPGLDRRRAGRAQRRGADPVPDRHHAQHRVVHGHDHVHRRLGVQLGDAGHVHGATGEDGTPVAPRRPSSAPASGCGRS